MDGFADTGAPCCKLLAVATESPRAAPQAASSYLQAVAGGPVCAAAQQAVAADAATAYWDRT